MVQLLRTLAALSGDPAFTITCTFSFRESGVISGSTDAYILVHTDNTHTHSFLKGIFQTKNNEKIERAHMYIILKF